MTRERREPPSLVLCTMSSANHPTAYTSGRAVADVAVDDDYLVAAVALLVVDTPVVGDNKNDVVVAAAIEAMLSTVYTDAAK